MTLHEPATFATDCALALWSVWLGWKIPPTSPTTCWWRRTFYWTAIAGLAGGIYHGFGPTMPATVAAGLWRATLLAISATSLCLTLAAAHARLAGRALLFCRRAAWVKVTLCAGYAMAQPVFLSAIADYGTALVFVLVVELRAWRTTAAKWILAGIAGSVIGAVVQQSGWAVSQHFNHNDLYHVIQMIALGLFYRGAQALR